MRLRDLQCAVEAGLVGAVAAYLPVVIVTTVANIRPDLQMVIGMALGLPLRSSTWVAGLLVYLAVLSGSAIFYSAGFEYLTRRAGWRVGAAFSLAHAGLACASILLFPDLQVAIQAGWPALPWNTGVIAASIVGFHIVYGGTVGMVYKRRSIEAI